MFLDEVLINLNDLKIRNEIKTFGLKKLQKIRQS